MLRRNQVGITWADFGDLVNSWVYILPILDPRQNTCNWGIKAHIQGYPANENTINSPLIILGKIILKTRSSCGSWKQWIYHKYENLWASSKALTLFCRLSLREVKHRWHLSYLSYSYTNWGDSVLQNEKIQLNRSSRKLEISFLIYGNSHQGSSLWKHNWA